MKLVTVGTSAILASAIIGAVAVVHETRETTVILPEAYQPGADPVFVVKTNSAYRVGMSLRYLDTANKLKTTGIIAEVLVNETSVPELLADSEVFKNLDEAEKKQVKIRMERIGEYLQLATKTVPKMVEGNPEPVMVSAVGPEELAAFEKRKKYLIDHLESEQISKEPISNSDLKKLPAEIYENIVGAFAKMVADWNTRA